VVCMHEFIYKHYVYLCNYDRNTMSVFCTFNDILHYDDLKLSSLISSHLVLTISLFFNLSKKYAKRIMPHSN